MSTVVKRNGLVEAMNPAKLEAFVGIAIDDGSSLNRVHLMRHILKGMPDSIPTAQIPAYLSEACMSKGHTLLAGRLAMIDLHKNTPNMFRAAMCRLPLAPEVRRRALQMPLDQHIDHSMDFTYDIFAVRTLMRAYLMRANGKIVERPQYMLMRVACSLYETEQDIVNCYKMLSQKLYTHATPTLFNAGMVNGQLASCFLLNMQDDSIEGIFNTVHQCAKISKYAGGIGLSISNIRGRGSAIKGTNGISNGIVPMLRVFNSTAKYVDQGGGKRKGSFAIYMEPWHPDIEDFLELRKNHGEEELRCRDLFLGLWTPDLFMERVMQDGDWSLFCPNTVNLIDVHSDAFRQRYEQAERDGLAVRTVKARALWDKIIRSQIETGTPYMLFKDTINRHSNQSHLGTIRTSNLCAEIVEFSSPDEIPVCTLSSIALPKFVADRTFDFDSFGKAVEQIVYNLDRVIDTTHYPLEETRRSNARHRNLGIGVQGLSDAFQMMNMDYESDECIAMDALIFEAMYFHALTASCALAKQHGPYPSYHGSPMSRGILHHDTFGVSDSPRFEWDALRKNIAQYGVRHAHLIALMPTASTAQILGNSEGMEPRTSNLYTRRVMSGEFIVENHVLKSMCVGVPGLWRRVRSHMMRHYGSVQACDGSAPPNPELPNRAVFKTAWEISNKSIIKHCAARQPFVCQSQSMNLYLDQPRINQVSAMHMFSWRSKLKTGMYYLRTKPRANAIQFTCEEECLSCGS